MLKHWMIMIGLILPLVGCNSFSSRHDSSNEPVIPVKVETLFFTPEEFTRIDVQGEMNLTIHTGARRSWFSMHGDSRDLRNVEWKVKKTYRGETLRIHLDGRFPKHGPVSLDIGVRHLTSLSYKGNGTVIGRNLNANELDLNIKNAKNTMTTLSGRLNLHHVFLHGDGQVIINSDSRDPNMDLFLEDKVRAKISGYITPKKIGMRGQSYLRLPKINSKHLRFHMEERSSAQFRGSAQWALMHLTGAAHFDGRHFPMKEAFVKTDDYAMALIYVTDEQHTLAAGNSNIYYYHAPTYQNDFMARNGSVLNLGAKQNSSNSKKSSSSKSSKH